MGRRTAFVLEVPTGPGGQSLREVYATGDDRPIPYWPGLPSIPRFLINYNRSRDQGLFHYILYEGVIAFKGTMVKRCWRQSMVGDYHPGKRGF